MFVIFGWFPPAGAGLATGLPKRAGAGLAIGLPKGLNAGLGITIPRPRFGIGLYGFGLPIIAFYFFTTG